MPTNPQSRADYATRFKKGRSGNPGGRMKPTTLIKHAVEVLKPLVSTGQYPQLVEIGRTTDPRDVWLASLARYRAALENPDTPTRELTVIARQVGEAAGILGMTRIHTTHDHYAHIPDELKPLIAEKLALLEYQRREKELLLEAPPLATPAPGDICVSSPSTDSKSINSGESEK